MIFDAAGNFYNNGLITAGGVFTGSYISTIHNNGVITGLVLLRSGGAVFNGSALGGPGSMSEVVAWGGSVVNFSTINLNGGGYGVSLKNAGLINGSGLDTTALVRGGDGVMATAGSVSNFGTIDGFIPGPTYVYGESGYGVLLNGGGAVTNGAANSRAALIEGYDGVGATGAAATVTNFGDIVGLNPGGGAGVDLAAGGRVVNGSPGDLTASITGYAGVVLGAAGTVINYAEISGSSSQGVRLAAGGRVVNGLGVDRGAVIEGLTGVEVDGAAGTVVNAATIIGDGLTSGVSLSAGGAVVNGSATDAVALIEGYSGVAIAGAGVSTNFGTILGLGLAGNAGARLAGGAHLTNGASGATSGLVEGYVGVLASGPAILANFGTVKGDGGTAVDFTSTGDVLAVEPGATFIGSIIGGGGTLDLAAGAWTHAGLLSSTGAITLSGPIATTTFGGFGALEVGPGASLTVTGAAPVSAAQGLIVAGSLTTTGTITSAGRLTVTGTLAGTGTLALTGGVANFSGTPSLTISKVTQSGGTVSFGGPSVTVSSPWTQTAGTITAPTGDRVNFSGAGDSFAGTLAGTGTIAFTGGTDAITGATLPATTMEINGAAVTLSGAIKLSGALFVTSTDLAIASAGVTLSGGGSLDLTNLATNAIKGATATAILTNGDKIIGAGAISSVVLVNQAGGSIIGNQTTALVINTGTSAVTNAGLIDNTGAGGTTITGAVANTGTLMVAAGSLTVDGAVSGAGTVKIAGGVAHFASTFAENVAFIGTTGVLELAHSQTYTGQIAGFSKTGTTSLDLLDIAFGGGTTAKFSGTTASGVLTVTDGTHTAKITLEGNYTASTFSVFSDGHGGTTVIDPTAPAGGAATPLQPLVSAMAAFGVTAGASPPMSALLERAPPISLLRAP